MHCLNRAILPALAALLFATDCWPIAAAASVTQSILNNDAAVCSPTKGLKLRIRTRHQNGLQLDPVRTAAIGEGTLWWDRSSYAIELTYRYDALPKYRPPGTVPGFTGGDYDGDGMIYWRLQR